MAASPQIKKGAADAASCVEGLRKKVLRIDGPFRAQGFLSLTALRAEGCGIALSVHSEHILHYANWICKGASAT